LNWRCRTPWPAVALAIIGAASGTMAAGIGWPEAVDRLVEERSNAVACAGSFKQYASGAQLTRGQNAYGAAKASFDGVIAGLETALGEGGEPQRLPMLEQKISEGAAALGRFCKMASDILPEESGQKGIVEDIVKAAVEPVIDALKQAIAALYNDHRKDEALTRATIRTQLEAARWPAFAEVEAGG